MDNAEELLKEYESEENSYLKDLRYVENLIKKETDKEMLKSLKSDRDEILEDLKEISEEKNKLQEILKLKNK